MSLEKIENFLSDHHVLSLATNGDDGLNVCNLFYAYDQEDVSFVVASSDDTNHIKDVLKNSFVAGSVVLETKTVAKIQGLQFKGEFSVLNDQRLKTLYFKTFPYSIALNPKLWKIRANYFKFTDNTLGFGKKLIWERD